MPQKLISRDVPTRVIDALAGWGLCPMFIMAIDLHEMHWHEYVKWGSSNDVPCY